MPESGHEQWNTGKLVLETLFVGFEKASEVIKKISLGALGKAKALILFLLIGFVASLAVTGIGIASDIKFLVIVGLVAKAFFALALCSIAALIAAIFGGKSLMRFTRLFFIYNMTMALVMMIVPSYANLSHFGIALFAGFLLGVINAWSGESTIAKAAVTLIFVGAVASVFLPSLPGSAKKGIEGIDSLIESDDLLKISSQQLQDETIPFYDKNGKVRVWYAIITGKKIELYTQGGYTSRGVERKAIDEKVIKLIYERKDNILSARNLISSVSVKNSPVAPAAPPPQTAYATPTPAPDSPPTNQPPAQPQPAYEPPAYQPPAMDNRKEYVVVAMDAQRNHDRRLIREMVTWLGRNRAVDAYDHLNNVHCRDGDSIDDNDRIRLSKIARKIVFVIYGTNAYDDGQVKQCSASIMVRIIDAENGNVIKEIPRSYSAQSGNEQDGRQIALGFVFKAIQNQFQKYM